MKSVILIIGLQGSGKSTLAHYLARQAESIILSTEVVRGAIFDKRPSLGTDEDFSALELSVTYRAINHFFSLLANSPINIIVEGVFRKESQRQFLLPNKSCDNVVKVYLHCPDFVAEERLNMRQWQNTVAPAGVKCYNSTKYQFEVPPEDYLSFDTSKNSIEEIARAIIKKQKTYKK